MASLHLGDPAPDFTAESTAGPLHFHEWIGDAWAVLFSHPADFTPVCTTELGRTAQLAEEFARRNVKPVALSVDPLDSHRGWIDDINETQKTTVQFPIVADPEQQVAQRYDMIHPRADSTHTVRSVFIIDPHKRIRATMTYPPSTGRNFGEILRVIDSLQLTDRHGVATPADWRPGDDCVILPSITDAEELRERFPKGWREERSYLRLTPDPSESGSREH
ncbi:MAG: peroxiredoxin [Pseudomonadota bacterium]|nr:peroxiredoxin [Pseudomonadota bacterium]HJO36324.1 peroxiredoxin [Gammaproteobacteria bacterium]